MSESKRKFPLALFIFIGLILGIAAGSFLTKTPEIAVKYIKPFGTLFLNLIKFIVVPIVFFSIINGIISMKDIKKVGKIGIKTIVYYLITTGIAVIIGLLFANMFKGNFGLLSTSGLNYEAKEAPSFIQTIVDMFPNNIITPFANANMLQVIVASIFFGFAIITAGEKVAILSDFVEGANTVSMIVMEKIISLSPIGVFCLITPVVAENGTGILGNLLSVLLVAYGAYLVHMLVIYSTSVGVLGKLSPFKFFKGMLPAIMMAFSSASSVGTLPLNMECTQKLGAKKDITSFVLPLGATINMDGTAIYQGVCAIFIATCFGIDLTLGQQVTIILTATLASIGTAGVPGAGMIMLAMVLQSVNLPIEGIALVAGVDRIFDMGRTVVNITGDSVAAIVVSKSES